MRESTKKMVWMGMLIALSFVGANIKIPGPYQSIALDSLPAFLGALMLGGSAGAIIGFLGHMLTAATAGFYMTLPVHIIVAVTMAITMVGFSFAYRKTNLVVAGIVGIILNGVGAPLILLLMPKFGWPFFMGIVPFLLVASGVNVLLSIGLFTALNKSGVGFNKGFIEDGK
ncbi:ECF transporter S component [Alkaliphilus hydrothermalis]|uniref:Riboflavin transporter FmnP n=1 Tax=Alkaliphilus hydrothermalis TaxID=1482730 RepID=A0ABS2NU04_9FIRM|nr:ECF transporter S component [Alkaliphilus hydrothermalis]MBM7616423.1 riboflavin transporter FmnP [Alkaliphilus hydrothermalis]